MKKVQVTKKSPISRQINLTSRRRQRGYKTTQKSLNEKQKKGFYNASLLVNYLPIKSIIDSGSPVTLIPECLFNEITKIKPQETTYKLVTNLKNELTGQTKAVVRTKRETIEVPLLITEARTIPLFGLD